MNIDSFVINDTNQNTQCKLMLKILNCNLLWVIKLNDNLLNWWATDNAILEHYWEQQYYLHDPYIKHEADKSPWKVTLGIDCNAFRKNGFLYDLHKIFNIEEFISIESNIGHERYCFRFFTKNSRHIFMNKVLNNMPIIKLFISAMIKTFEANLPNRSNMNIPKLE